MRLTSAKVETVQAAVLKGTGQKWITIGGSKGYGTRYTTRTGQTVYIGGTGAAQALSYLAGVAHRRNVSLGSRDVFDIMDYLRSSGRLDYDAKELGHYHAGRTSAQAPWFAMLTSSQVEEGRRERPMYQKGHALVARHAQAQARNPQVCYQGVWHVWKTEGPDMPVPEGDAPITVTVWSADAGVFHLEWAGPGVR